MVTFLSEFSFARTVWFNPFLWCLAFMFVFNKIDNKIYISILCIFAFFINSIIKLLSNAKYNNIGANIKNELGIKNGLKGTEMTYNDFYSAGLFKEIKKI